MSQSHKNNQNIFRRNIQALSQVDLDLARRLTATHPAAAEVIQTRSGVPSVRLTNAGGKPCTLVSTIDPLAEAESLAESQLGENANACLVYGFALGYHVESVLKRLPRGGRVLVVDPQISIFRLAMETRDLTGLLTNPDVFWSIGEKEYDVGLLSSATGEKRYQDEQHAVTYIIHNTPHTKSISDFYFFV